MNHEAYVRLELCIEELVRQRDNFKSSLNDISK